MTGDPAIRKVVILGGGTAGWIAACALAKTFKRRIEIVLVESADIPIVGVGEATIPPIVDFLRYLEIDEQDFMAATQATYKAGIVFKDWLRPDHHYWHPFGTFGGQINGRPFHHYWHRAKRAGRSCSVSEYSLAAALGNGARFLRPTDDNGALIAGLRYAFHFDAGLVGRYLRRVAELLGVARMEATVTGIGRSERGHIDELILSDGRRLAADLFIDCSGFRGTLIGEQLGVPYLDWRHVLPCDRAVAVPSGILQPRPPYTLAAAHMAGWRWQIPLQHRTGNGLVYCSQWMEDDEAERLLIGSIGGAPLAEPRRLRFTPGRREVFWSGNCVSLGLASGFLEPLESTSIHLVVSGIYKLLDHFPDRNFGQHNIDAYNRAVVGEFDAVRDFIILHYCLTQRRDSAFWRYCATMALPDTLRERIELYREAGRIIPRPFELFTDLSWFYVLDGMGLDPIAYDPVTDLPAIDDLLALMDRIKREVSRTARRAPGHDAFFAAERAATNRAFATASPARDRA